MNSQELRNLQEAYLDVYENEYLDEASRADEFTRAAIARNSGRKGGITFEPGPNWDASANRGKGAHISPKQKEKQRRKALRQENVDLYDIILSHLLDEAAVNWNTGKTKSGLSPEQKTALKFLQHRLSNKPQNQKRAEQQALVDRNMTGAIKKTGKRRVDKVGPIASTRFKNAAIRQRGGKQSSVPIKTVPGLRDANEPAQTRREQIDLYDIILSHLLDEGYADTIEGAEVIMVNMSEEWRDDIMEISQKTATRAFAQRATGEFEYDTDPRDRTKSGEYKSDVAKGRIERKFGKKAGQHAERAAHAQIFGRKGAGGMPPKP